MNPRLPLVLLLSTLAPLWAQRPEQTLMKAADASAAALVANTAPSPLGTNRATPRAAMMGFLRAAQSGKYKLAAQFLQVNEADRDHRGAQLARELSEVMDQMFAGNIDIVNNTPEGALDDGLAADRELAGSFANDKGGPFTLVRVQDRVYGPIWLISAETLAQVPELYAEVGYPALERRLPEALVETRWLGVALWRWMAAVVLVPLSFGLAWLIIQLLVALPLRLIERLRKAVASGTFGEIRMPLVVLLTMFVHYIVLALSGIPLLFRQYYGRVVRISLTLAVAWLVWRWVSRGMRSAHARVAAMGNLERASVILLGQRLIKTFVVVSVILISLSMLGFEMKTFLAGLGIGGIAVALAAQKTLENVFGGIWVLSDRSIRVGDFCAFGAQRGVVEDIGLRSTRIRTQERTVVTIPNGQLANMIVENFAMRDKLLFNPTLGLRYETTGAQLAKVLDGVRALIEAHPRLEREGSRVRLLRLGQASIDIEVFVYVRTTDFAEFAAIRDELTRAILRIVEQAGAAFAVNPPTVSPS